MIFLISSRILDDLYELMQVIADLLKTNTIKKSNKTKTNKKFKKKENKMIRY